MNVCLVTENFEPDSCRGFGMSLDLEVARELLDDPQLSDEEIRLWCDSLRALIVNIFQQVAGEQHDY